MDHIIYVAIILIAAIVVFGLLWRAGATAVSLAPLGPTGQALVYIVGLILLALLVWWLVTNFVGFPR